MTKSTSESFTSNGNFTSISVSSKTSSSRPSSVSAKAGSGNPRLLPILCTLPIISLQYFCPTPIESITSLAAIDISAVSIPMGQKTAHLLHCEH